MVLENLFAGVVNQFLGNYIENVTSKDMSFGLDGRSFCTLIKFVQFSLLKCDNRCIHQKTSEVEFHLMSDTVVK